MSEASEESLTFSVRTVNAKNLDWDPPVIPSKGHLHQGDMTVEEKTNLDY